MTLTKTNVISVDSKQASIDGLIARIEDLKSRAEILKQAKISAKTEIDLLKKQWDGLVQEAQLLGIEDTKNLSSIIQQHEAELSTLIQELSDKITSMESNV